MPPGVRRWEYANETSDLAAAIDLCTGGCAVGVGERARNGQLQIHNGLDGAYRDVEVMLQIQVIAGRSFVCVGHGASFGFQCSPSKGWSGVDTASGGAAQGFRLRCCIAPDARP